MANGTYIFGYQAGGADCIRSFVNGAQKGEVPVAEGAPKISNTSLSIEGSKMTIVATADLSSLDLPAGGKKVLYAASSAPATVPTTCDEELAATMHHDLGGKGFVGSADVSFAAGAIQTV